jgi:hypothetical protein
MPKKSKTTPKKDALLDEVKHEMEQPRIAQSVRIQETDEAELPRSVKEIAMKNNWLAFLQTEATDISTASHKKK